MARESRPKKMKWVFCDPTKYAYGMRVVVISGHCERECFLLGSCFLPCSRRQSRIPRKTSRVRTFILGLFRPLGICVCLRVKGRKYKRVGQKCVQTDTCVFVCKCTFRCEYSKTLPVQCTCNQALHQMYIRTCARLTAIHLHTSPR